MSGTESGMMVLLGFGRKYLLNRLRRRQPGAAAGEGAGRCAGRGCGAGIMGLSRL